MKTDAKFFSCCNAAAQLGLNSLCAGQVTQWQFFFILVNHKLQAVGSDSAPKLDLGTKTAHANPASLDIIRYFSTPASLSWRSHAKLPLPDTNSGALELES